MIPANDPRRTLTPQAGQVRNVRAIQAGCWLYLAPLPDRPDAYGVWGRVEWAADLFHGMSAGAGNRIVALRIHNGEGGAIRVDAPLVDSVIMLSAREAKQYGLRIE